MYVALTGTDLAATTSLTQLDMQAEAMILDFPANVWRQRGLGFVYVEVCVEEKYNKVWTVEREYI